MKTKEILLISTILLIIIVPLFISGCDITTKQEIKSIISDIKESPEVTVVRKAPIDDSVTLGDLIDSGISDTVWEIYDPAEDGNKYVTISGNVLYEDTLVVVKIQYQIYDDEKIGFNAMTYNDVPQKKLEATAMFNYLKEEYKAQHEPAN
jgi:hypothetical protein